MLKYALIMVMACSLVLTGFAQVKFPSDIVGNYTGPLLIYSTPSRVDTVEMELQISPTDTAGYFRWNILYGTDKSDSRDYRLIVIDETKGLVDLDELNSIIIPGKFDGQTFHFLFEVEGSILYCAYEFSGNTCVFTVVSGNAMATITSGGKQEGIPLVKSYLLYAPQKAILKKKK